ncbi:MAG: sulfatase [Proteobacteria bacterium]|nr:sulfatase [Pseudomonadota bacterium]MCP4915708.1 sulfatase [Pseudomonadota bacterium]
MLLSYLLLTACGDPEPVVPPPAQRPTGNVVFITLDTTRADALGAYGRTDGASPVFDKLAARGVLFEWCIAHVPTTLSSHSSMFTGLDPHGHSVPKNGYPLYDEHDTVAERLSAAGFDTVSAIAASPLGSDMGVQQGFRVVSEELQVDKVKRHEARAHDVTTRALAAVDQSDAEKPLFLWVHYYDAHSPYEAPAKWVKRFVTSNRPWGDPDKVVKKIATAHRSGDLQDADREWLRQTYQAEVAYQDDQVGVLLAGLDERGVLRDSWIVITADHGEMFFEDKSSPVGHGPDIELAVTHVPLLVVPPASLGIEPMRVDQVVKSSDLGPTLLAIAGQSTDLGDGQDLSPLWSGGDVPETPVFMEATRSQIKSDKTAWNNADNERGVVSGDRVLIRSRAGSDGLYDRTIRPQRLTEPEVRDTLAVMLDGWDSSAPPYREITFSEDVQEALRALGYID